MLILKQILTNHFLMNNLPFSSIGPYSDSFTSTTLLSRMIEGIGFRFYWATEGLRQIDLDYKPCEDGRSCYENIEHISMLTDAISDAFAGRIYDYGTDISHTHVTADWYDSHEGFLKSFMGSPSDANKVYQNMLNLRDLRYKVLMKKHMSLR